MTFFVSTYKGLRRVAHGGAINTFGANFDLLPEAGTAAILLCNRRSAELAAGVLVDEIFDLLLHRPPHTSPLPVEPARDRWPQYIGTYLGPWAGLARIAVVDDHLVLEWNGELVPLAAYRDDLYAGRWQGNEQLVSVGFYSPVVGTHVAPYIVVNSMPCRRMDHEPDARPDLRCWQAYASTYHGLNTFRVRVEGNQLVVRTQGAEEGGVCISLGDGRFACRYGLLAFALPVDGASPALTLGGELTLSRVAEGAAPAPM